METQKRNKTITFTIDHGKTPTIDHGKTIATNACLSNAKILMKLIKK